MEILVSNLSQNFPSTTANNTNNMKWNVCHLEVSISLWATHKAKSNLLSQRSVMCIDNRKECYRITQPTLLRSLK